MFSHFRQQAEALIEAVNKNTSELLNIRMRLRNRPTPPTPPAPQIDTTALQAQLTTINESLAALLAIEQKRARHERDTRGY